MNRLITTRQSFLNKKLKPYGLTSCQLSFLLEIAKEKKIPQNKLSEKLMVDSALTSRGIKKLYESGYIYIDEKEGDKRFKLISLTLKGEQIKEELLSFDKQWVDLVSKGIPTYHQDFLESNLKQMLFNAEIGLLRSK